MSEPRCQFATTSYSSEPGLSGRLARATRTTRSGDRIQVRRRATETDDQFVDRVEWGRFDELVIDWIAALEQVAGGGTLGPYRSDCNVWLLPRLGERWLTDCDIDAYAPVLAIADEANIGRYIAAHRTLGALISWAVTTGRWPLATPAFGGSDYRSAVHRKKLRSSPVKVGKSKRGKTIDDCPAFDEARCFGDALGTAAAAKWGVDARELGEVPVVQYLTGARVATAFAMHANGFHPERETPSFHLQWQIDRDFSWTPAGLLAPSSSWQPPLKLIKNQLAEGYEAVVWDWALPTLGLFAHEAAAQRGGWLFATLIPDSLRPLDAFEQLYLKVRREVGYRWTSHYHRHAYASWNLAPTEMGGYDTNVATVAEWLGDTVEITSSTYWHPTKTRKPGWSDHRPGRR